MGWLSYGLQDSEEALVAKMRDKIQKLRSNAIVGRWIAEKRRHIRIPTAQRLAQRLEQPVGWGAAEDATWPKGSSGMWPSCCKAWAEPVEGAG